jgi:hypothetical protein
MLMPIKARALAAAERFGRGGEMKSMGSRVAVATGRMEIVPSRGL